MAISTDQKVDYLFKKLGYGVTKTDINSVKLAPNESIPSPLLMRGDTVWRKSEEIPATIPSSDTSVVTIYNSSNPVECTPDITTTTNRTWKTGLTDWIPTEFGSTYLVSVYVHTAGDAAGAVSLSNKVFVTGSGNNDEWFFDYQSGVLNFIGDNLPSGVSFTGKSVYITGARYTGPYGVGALAGEDVNLGNLTIANTTIGTLTSNDNIILSATGTGVVEIAGTNGLLLPVGTTSERPYGSEYAGTLRFNSTLSLVEFYNGASWQPLNPEVSIDSQVFDGDGSTATFTLLRAVSAIGLLVSINGTMQQPSIAYVVSGDEITFDEAPRVGDVVELRYITLGYDNAVNTLQTTNAIAFYNTPNTVAASSNYTFNPSTSRLSLNGDFSIGNIVIKDDGSNKIGFYQADGVTPAIINATTEIVADSIASGNSELTFSGVNGNIVANVAGSTVATLTSSGIHTNLTGAVTGTTVSASGGFSGNLTGDVAGNVTGNVTGNLTGAVIGDVTGNLTGNVVGDVSGNASTASKLATGRLISLAGDLTGSITFDGSSNVTLTAAVASNAVALGTNTTGNYVASLVAGTGITLANNTGEGATPTISINATEANTASAVVKRDTSGNFSAGTITANLTGTATGIEAKAKTTNSAYKVPFTTILSTDTGTTLNTTLSYDTLSNGFTYNPSTNVLTVGTVSGNATSATNASKIYIDTSVTNADFAMPFTNKYYGMTGGITAGNTSLLMTDTTSPTYNPATATMTVTNISGTASRALYADLAEKYIADNEYEPGTIVEFGGVEEVTETKVDHSVKVAGVISTDPAYLMNSGSTGVAVALMGKVPCKVTGKVHKGDRIVSSDIPGVGMALDPSKYQPGCIIGKALTSSDGGLAVIEVVVGRI